MRVRNQRLPTGYREVEYLESTGTQWIDSNVSIAAKTNMKCKVIWTNISGSYPMLYGAWNIFALSSMPSKKLCIASGGYSGNNPWSSGPTIDANILYTIEHLPNKLTINGTAYTIPNAAASNNANDRHVLLFAASNSGNTPYNWSTYAKARVYYFKLYNDATIVRNFVPCVRVSDSKPGLYDTVNSTFYTNSGTGEFIAGPYHDSYKVPIYPRLPSAYQEVEYIKSEGKTQWINTGYYPKLDKTKVVADAIKDVGYSIFGSGSSGFTFTGSATHYAYYNGSQINTATTYTNRHLWIMDKNKLYIDGVSYGTYTLSTKVCTNPLGIFGRIKSTSPITCGDRGNHTLYSLKIYEDDKLVMHFIPCYRKSDSVIGLYDIITQTFFTNQGTGTFTKGDNVNNIQMCKLPYLIAEGTTNLKPWSSTITSTTITGWDTTKNGGSTAYTRSGWGYGYNSGVPSPSVGYHAHWVYLNGELIMKFPNLNSEVSQKGRWLGIAGDITLPWHAGDKYTISWEQMTDNINLIPFGGVYYKLTSSSSNAFNDGCPSLGNANKVGVWERKSRTFTVNSSYDGTVTSASIYIYGYSSSQEGTIYVRNIQVEYKDHATPFTPSTRPDNTII